MFNTLTTKLALRKVGLPTTNPFANASNPFANVTVSNPFADAKNPFANGQNPFAGAKNPFTQESAAAVPKAVQSWTGSNNVIDPVTGEVTGQREIASCPRVGDDAPSGSGLMFPRADGKGSLVVFLRACGDPFAQQTLLNARTLSNKHPTLVITLVSHSPPAATQAWLAALGGAWNLQIVCDPEKVLYAAWGLGQSRTWYVFNPVTQMEVRRLGTQEGIWGSAYAEGADKWLMAGYWAVDGRGKVRCGARSEKCEEKMDLVGAANVLGFRG